MNSVMDIINYWRPFTMFVNARLLYISVDGLHYSSGGQVILTVECFYMPATPVVQMRATTIQCMWPGDLDC
jgi:hypothetical protein